MKTALIKDTLREVRRSPGRFLSIFAIVALGAGFFAGIQATCPDMLLTADAYFATQQLMDVKLLSTYGFDEKDLDALRQVDGVAAIQPAYSKECFYKNTRGDSVLVKAMSLPDASAPDWWDSGMNAPRLESGRMPQAPNECLGDSNLLLDEPMRLGQTITLFTGDEEDPLSDTLRQDTYTVVGLVKSPQYISFKRGSATIGNGSVDCFVLLPQQNFSLEVATEVYMTLEDTQGLSAFSPDYSQRVDTFLDGLEPLAERRKQERYQEILDEANQKLEEARAELADGEKTRDRELADAQAELKQAQLDLQDARKKLDDGKVELAENQEKFDREIARAEKRLADGQKELENGQEAYVFGARQLAEGRAQYQANREQFDPLHQEFLAQEELLRQSRTQLEQAQAQVDALRQGDVLLTQAMAFAADYTGDAVQLEQGQALLIGLQKLDNQLAGLEDTLPEGTPLPPLPSVSEPFAALLADPTPENAALFTQTAGGLSAALTGLANTLDSQLAPQWQQLEAGEALLEQNRPAIESAAAQLEAARIQLEAADAEMKSSSQELIKARRKLERGQRELETQRAEGLQKLADARVELADGEVEYTDGLADYRQGLLDYQKAERDSAEELEDARQKISDAQGELDDLKRPVWYLQDRSINPSYASYEEDAQRVANVARVFPVFFLLVAALVCLTTMARMVEEQRTQMGSLMALGYTNAQIAAKFLAYAAIASLAGSAVGLAVGFRLFPAIIFGAYGIMYTLPSIIAPFRWPSAIAIALSFLFCTAGVALSSCYRELRAVPAQLMRPKAPKAGKRVLLERVPFLWNRLGFLHKVTVRNLFRYKRRIAMTVLGISGCTALMVTGFGLRDSIAGVVDRQYAQIFHYDVLALLDDKATQEEQQAAVERLAADPLAQRSSSVLFQSMEGGSGNAWQDTYLFVPQDTDRLAEFITLQTRLEKEPVPLTDEGAVITEKLAELLSLSAGDTLTLRDSEQNTYSLPITGVVENYTMHYVYLTPAGYQRFIGKDYAPNGAILSLSQDDKAGEDAFAGRQVGKAGLLALSFSSDTRSTIGDVMGSMDYIVLILIVCAGALAFVVLYNLTNINITERIREIATIKVLGFYDREVAAYVNRENLLLTLLGAAAGLGLGKLLHAFVIRTAEVDTVMFGRSLSPKSYLLAFLFTLFFSLLVNGFMHFKLRKISMVESLKSVE